MLNANEAEIFEEIEECLEIKDLYRAKVLIDEMKERVLQKVENVTHNSQKEKTNQLFGTIKNILKGTKNNKDNVEYDKIDIENLYILEMQFYKEMQQWKLSEEMAKKILENNESIENYNNLGEIYTITCQYEKAYQCYEKCMQDNNYNFATIYMALKVCVGLKKYDSAIIFMSNIEDLLKNSRTIGTLCQSIIQYRYDELQEKMKEETNNVQYISNLAYIYYWREELENAYNLLTNLCEDEETEESVFTLLSIYYINGEVDKANRIIDEKTTKYPQSLRLKRLKVKILMSIHKEDKALDLCNQILKDYPLDYGTIVSKIKILFTQNDYKNAIPVINGLQENYFFAEVHELKMTTYLNMNIYEEVYNTYRAAVRNNVRTSNMCFIKAKALLSDGRITDALDTMDEAIHLEPEVSRWTTEKGIMLFDSNQFQECIETMREAILINSTDDIAFQYMIEALHRMGEYREAEEIAKLAVEKGASNHSILKYLDGGKES